MSVSRPDILLVEDDDNDVALIRRAFEKAGVPGTLHVVSDGDAAIEWLAGGGGCADRARCPMPVAVLLDLKLPRRSGFEVLRWVRGEAGLHALPIVVLTSSRETGDVDQAYRLGANSYLVKPVAFDALLALTRAFATWWLELNQYLPAPAA